MLATLGVYYPVIRFGGYIWDDDAHVLNNRTLLTLGGLRDIWLNVTSTQQYYPLVFSSFWLEHRVWGIWPTGYHLVNVLLHAATAVVLWQLLEKLRVRGAWLAAALFALHPVNVESVAWISERKNVLCGFFVLCTAHAYLRFALPELFGSTQLDRRAPSRSSGSYLLAFLLFCCALFSKTVACTLPAAMLLIIWWKRGKLSASDWLRAGPFFVVGGVMALLTGALEKGLILANGAEYALSPVDRILIAGRAVWFYAAKVLWPAKLVFIYPRWSIDAHHAWQFLFPGAALGAIFSIWMLRNRIGRGPVTALLYFGGTLVPALGFVNLFPMRYSFVADHFQYLAMIGLVTVMAAGSTRVLQMLPPVTATSVCAALLLALGCKTMAQQTMYENERALWLRTIELNDRAALAYTDLGYFYGTANALDDAEKCFERAVELTPDDPAAQYNLGEVYATTHRNPQAADRFRRAIELLPNYADAHEALGAVLHLMDDDNGAVAQLRQAITLNPEKTDAYYRLSQALCSQGKQDEGIRVLRTSARVIPNAKTHFNIAAILEQQGKRAEAIAELHEALRMQPDLSVALHALSRLESAGSPATSYPR